MDPYQDGFPHHLSKISKIEEMLIACVYSVMKTYQLKGGTIVGYKDFRVHHQAIQQWLTFLQANNPLHTDINTDFGFLFKLTEDSSVESQVIVVEEEELGQDAQNISTAARDTNTFLIQATLGPDQGRATGINDPDKDQIIEGYIAAPLISNSQTENEQL
eukprot:13742175-Ditylum_brightwellii.AAC.1